MELTIKQIKEKKKELKKDLLDRLNQFKEETGLYVTGEINNGPPDEEMKHWVIIKCPNPFM